LGRSFWNAIGGDEQQFRVGWISMTDGELGTPVWQARLVGGMTNDSKLCENRHLSG
jgi:hypothetical protein